MRVEPDTALAAQCQGESHDAGQHAQLALDGRALEGCHKLPCHVQLAHVQAGLHVVSAITTCSGARGLEHRREAELAFEVRLQRGKSAARPDAAELREMAASHRRLSPRRYAVHCRACCFRASTVEKVGTLRKTTPPTHTHAHTLASVYARIYLGWYLIHGRANTCTACGKLPPGETSQIPMAHSGCPLILLVCLL